MQTKTKNIVLVTPEGEKQTFDMRHAECLLGMGDSFNGGWRIEKESKYYFDKTNGIRVKSDKGNTAGAE